MKALSAQVPLQMLVLESRAPFRRALIDTWNRHAVEFEELPTAFSEGTTLADCLPNQTFEACIMPVVAQNERHAETWARLEEAGYTITYLFHLTLERAETPSGDAGQKTTTVTRQVVPYMCRTRFGSHHRVVSVLARMDPVVSEIIPAGAESPHERYRKLLNRLSEGFWDIGPDLNIAYANAAFKSIFGDPKPVGKNLLEFFDDEDRGRLRSILANQQEGIIIPFTMRVKNKSASGRGKVIQIDPSPRFGWSGQYLGGWALIRDVGDQSAEMEKTLRQERELYALYAVASTLSRGYRLNELVKAATRSIREQLGVDATCAWIRTPGSGTLEPIAPIGLDDRPLDDKVLADALAWCEDAPESKPAVVVRDTGRSRHRLARVMGEHGYRSVAAIPLLEGSERIGYLWLACHDPSVMNRAWVSLLISIGHQLALAVVNALGVEARLREEARQKQFYRDAVCAITNGKLSLVDRAEIMEIMAGTHDLARMPIETREDVQNARKLAEATLGQQGFSDERIFDIATCVTEAATNTLLHGRGGVMRITDVPADRPDGARIVLEDRGPGINFSELPRAILKRGYSTAVSMGLGYTLILDMMDAVYLATDTAGTMLVMEAAQNPVNAELEAWLAKVSD